MGLKSDIKDALLKATGADKVDNANITSVDNLAKDLSTAIIEFLKKQTWTITELTSVLEVERLETSTNLTADILPSVTYITPAGAPAPLTTRLKGVRIPKLKLSNSGGQGGQLITIGKAYVGKKAAKVKGGGKHAVKWNNFTKVQLDPNKIKGK